MPDFAVVTAFRATDKMSPAFNKMGGASERFGRRATGAFGRASVAAGRMGAVIKSAMPLLGVGAVVAGFKKVVDSARMIEDARAAFTPLIGGAEKAEKLVNKLNITAASTPFQFDTLANSAKQLLPVMKGDINNTIATIRMLGDTAGGNAEKMKSITRGFTKAMLKGKVDMESLNMVAEAGVPIFTEMAKSMGFGENQMSKFFKQISTGKVPTSEMVKVFEKMTGKGGIFFEGMIIASKTTSGVLSTMSDNLTLLAAEIGGQLLPHIKQFALWSIESAKAGAAWIKENKSSINLFVSGFAKLAGVLPYIVGGFIAYKVALKGVALWQGIMMAAGWIKYLFMMREFITAVTIKQWLWNAAMAANPAGLIALGILAIVGAVILLIKYWDEWGASFSLFLGPVGMLVSYFKTLYDQWEAIKAAFTTGGIIAGLKALGLALFDAMIAPFKQLWGMIKSVTGIGSAEAPNKAEVASRNQTTNINIRNRNVETEAEVAPRRGATINYAAMGAN